MSESLEGKIALVTGASRGAGRGIALELALLGCKVFITGRSRRGNSVTQYPDLTLDDTKEIIEKAGGRCEILECDHSEEDQIRSVFEIITQKEGTLDILVNNVWAGYTNKDFQLDIETDNFTAKFWEQPLYRWDHMFQISLRSHFICSQEAAQLMIPNKSGLIVTTGFWDDNKYLHQVPYDLVKQAKARLAFGMAIDLLEYSITSVYISMGWIRTEHLMRTSDNGKLNDENYVNVEGYESSESTRYVGRAIVALASDSDVLKKTGNILTTGELAKEYGFTDLDGLQPRRFVIPDDSKGLTQR
ncbi:MAG: SDR family oxidoreductase [Candidatus Thorarchaeota archaeon]|jgi:NAD(P)-dependent dehydrogenase (short-subunit alcohol dehydrogenase family)